jgi:hypothetical protein
MLLGHNCCVRLGARAEEHEESTMIRFVFAGFLAVCARFEFCAAEARADAAFQNWVAQYQAEARRPAFR